MLVPFDWPVRVAVGEAQDWLVRWALHWAVHWAPDWGLGSWATTSWRSNTS